MQGQIQRGQLVDEKVMALKYVSSVGEAGYRGGHDVCIHGDYAYVASYFGDGLIIFDISDPETVSVVSALNDVGHSPYDRLNGAHDVRYSGGYVYITKMIDHFGIVVVDVRDPETPVIVDTLIDTTRLSSTHALEISADGNYLYAHSYHDNDGWFNIIDISDPTNISFYGGNADPGGYRSCAEVGNIVYAARTHGSAIGVRSFNVSDKTNPIVLDTLETAIGHLVYDPKTKHVFHVRTVDGFAEMHVVDVSDPSALVSANSIRFPKRNVIANYMCVDDNYAYVSTASETCTNTIEVVDISDPYNLEHVYSMVRKDMLFNSGIAAVGNYVYSAPRNQNDIQMLVFRKSQYILKPRNRMMLTTRDMAAASGDVHYDCGFHPVRVRIVANISDNAQSDGDADEDCIERVIYTGTTRTSWASNYMVYLHLGSDGYQLAVMKDYDATGFTLTWTKYLSPAGTVHLRIFAFE